ncbi:MAG TPA: GNAT family N-acyltransferase [Paenalcaligenes sp.]|nr:GNAT family N-acyltransferase [Paenalcaligenes sp.]
MANGLQLRLAQDKEELKAIQRLRFKIFSEEMNAVFPDSPNGLDADQFDAWCDHFMVMDQTKDKVVGTYRFLSPENARLAGDYYSASEFDLQPLAGIRDQLVEVGRSCIHPKYRTGAVIMLLWSGIADLMRQGGYRYLLGCASVSLRDDGVTAAKVWREAQRMQQKVDTDLPQLQPLHRYPVEKLNSHLPAKIPPLIKGYLNLGAVICGEPAWDPDFNTADFPVLLDLQRLDPRYKRHFGLED